MHTIYSFISGPMVWVTFIIFIMGTLYRFVSVFILAKKKDPVVYAYTKFHYAMRSMFHWLIPFMSVNMRKHLAMTCIAFIFHICLLVTPIFLFSHIILFHASWNISWWHLSDDLADMMTVVVILSCMYFFIRRLILPEVKYLTTTSDYLVLTIVAFPFISGLWTYHQWLGFRITGILHILSGEILLISIPFTRLSHMLFFPFVRAYMGSEFGGAMAKDW